MYTCVYCEDDGWIGDGRTPCDVCNPKGEKNVIKKLEDILWTDENGNRWVCRPNSEDIIAKVNEVIEFINRQDPQQKEPESPNKTEIRKIPYDHDIRM